jgi:hypothetical protein
MDARPRARAQVGVVYSSGNVWANVQPAGAPWDLAWDLDQGACWRPFFGGVLPPRELASTQASRLLWVQAAALLQPVECRGKSAGR